MVKDPYVYPGTGVLINKFGERDKASAAYRELLYSGWRAGQLEVAPIAGTFDYAHLRAIHRHLFQDIYNWAGEPRTVQTSKGVPFCVPGLIDEQSRFVHRQLTGDRGLMSRDHAVFVDRLAYHWAEVNVIHAFREGNTRTQRVFFTQLMAERGWVVNFDALNYTQFKQARHHAIAGTHEQFAQVLAPVIQAADELPRQAELDDEAVQAKREAALDFPAQPSALLDTRRNHRRRSGSSVARGIDGLQARADRDPGAER